MLPSTKLMVYLILQFLNEENFKESLHKLEKESGIFFNMRYFEEAITNGKWEEVEDYLSAFTKIDDNIYSMKIFFKIRKQKYLEALDIRDHAKAVQILSKELKFFSMLNIFKELAMLLTLQNFRENEHFSRYGDIRSARVLTAMEVKKLIESNPVFRGKLQFPMLRNSGLRRVINRRQQLYAALSVPPITNPSSSYGPRRGGLLPIEFPLPLPCRPGPSTISFMQNRPISAWNIGQITPNHADPARHTGKRPRTENVLETSNHLVPYNGSGDAQSSHSTDDVTKIVEANLSHSQTMMSMNFHPVERRLLANHPSHEHGTNAPADRRMVIWIERPGMRRFGPTGITSDIMNEVMSHLPCCAPTWKIYPKDMKDFLYAEFKAKYRFVLPEDEALSWTVWDQTCQDRYRDNIRKIRIEGLKKNDTDDIEQTRGNPPREINVEVWDKLVDHWLSEEFQRRSESGRANRSAITEAALHIRGSSSSSE